MKFIMPILLGAVIDIHNWLAIKCYLDLMQKRKYLVYTYRLPGLIPKMNRIAKSIGETVGVHLLSLK